MTSRHVPRVGAALDEDLPLAVVSDCTAMSVAFHCGNCVYVTVNKTA